MPQSDSPPQRRRSPSEDYARRSSHRDSEHRRKDDYRDAKRSRSRSPPRRRPRSRSIEARDDRRNRDNDRDRRLEKRLSRSPRRNRSPEPFSRKKGPLPSQVAAFKSTTNKDRPSPGPEKQKPNWRPSGLLAAASNTISTSAGAIVLKYHEPPEARKPPASQSWRMYIFKGEEIIDELEIYLQSCWLFGREVSVCDYALEHPSCSKQHAVIQFRYIEKRNEFGDKIGKVRPYVIDLESANGTIVNDERVPEGRYMELRDKDVVKFGLSTREYVVQLPPA